MKGLELLFLHNKKKRSSRSVIVGKGCYPYQKIGNSFDLESLHDILCFINNVIDNTPYNLPIVLMFINVKGDVKLPVILLECISYYILKIINKPIICLFKVKRSIYSNYLKISPLFKLNHLSSELNKEFIKSFCFSLSMYHYRILLDSKALETDILSKKYDDVCYFLMNNGVSESVAEDIAEVAVELMGNASEHGESDCLLDINIDDSIVNKNNDKEYYCVNICVLNFSEKLFNDDIKIKITSMSESLKKHPRYKALYKAYQYHSRNFNDGYCLENFLTIAAYQHRISGRQENGYVGGGTGLTKLIKNLQTRSALYHCYMISGYRCLYFDKKYLDYDKDEWLGFNTNKNFLSDVPAPSQFVKLKFYMPGTAYNLTFVIERGQ